jgi:hypothetical protein
MVRKIEECSWTRLVLGRKETGRGRERTEGADKRGFRRHTELKTPPGYQGDHPKS